MAKIGIGTNAPSTKLDIDGQIRIRGGVPDVGKVLTSDANGTATWETPITTTAINGLTLNGTVMELGGPLTKTTRISMI